MVKVDVHNYKQRLVVAMKKLEKSEVCEEAKKDIMTFNDYSLAKGISGPRMAKYVYSLTMAAEILGKSFTEASKDDIMKVVNKIRQKDWAEYTKHDFCVILKRFYKWLEGGDEEYPDKVKWIRTTMKIYNRKLPEVLLTKEEVKTLIEVADHIRDKALVSVLYESGCRIGEILSMRIQDVTFEDIGGKIIVDGKTGMRRITLVASMPFLSAWLEYHPLRCNPDAPLWPIMATRNRYGFFNYTNANKLIKRLAVKACIKKRVNPHIFRHSRATHLANHLTEAQMNHYFGWVQGSKMPSTYVHLSGRDLDSKIFEINGLKVNEEQEKEKEFVPRKCLRCKESNPPTGKYCIRCGSPLDQETIIVHEDQRKKMDELMSTLLRDPDVRTIIFQKLRNLRNGGDNPSF